MPTKFISLETSPFHRLPFQSVMPGGKVAPAELPFIRGFVDGMPNGLEAMVLAADLQGHEMWPEAGHAPRLLGECLAEELASLCDQGILPPPDRIGIVLAGDLYARPEMDRRGGSGDVRHVWESFARRFRWVVGVAGNHDVFGEKPAVPDCSEFLSQTGAHFLDGAVVELDSLLIGGLSGVIGNPRKLFRREESGFLSEIGRLLKMDLDLLVLHDGPDGGHERQLGWPSVREVIEKAKPTLVVRGHAHWENPVARMANDSVALNVDSRVVVLRSLSPAD